MKAGCQLVLVGTSESVVSKALAASTSCRVMDGWFTSHFSVFANFCVRTLDFQGLLSRCHSAGLACLLD